MATALQGFRFTARSCTCLAVTKPYLYPSNGALALRTISSSPAHWKRSRITKIQERRKENAMKKIEASGAPAARRVVATVRDWEDEESDDVEHYPGEWVDETFEEFFEEELDIKHPPFSLPEPKRKKKDTFLNLGEEEPWESEEMMEDDEDDITSIGHGELERHREMRHYSRLIAWEMPMLSKLAKPFVPPTKDMPLRFRYTSYMGEHHPAEKKVVVEFTLEDMPNLDAIQRSKLAKLLGVRYNPTTDIAKMSCEMYESQAQNKRYLGNTIDKLLIEARDPTDTFEDIPLDTRHHYFKPRPRFPEAWTMTPERAKELKDYRLALEIKEAKLALRGQLVDGMQVITDGLKQPSRMVADPEMVMAGRGAVKGQRKMAVKRY